MSDNKPSRFHASPAQIDAFLRERFAEDALLNFYRAVGDEVLDEIQTSGQTFRRLQEQAQAKHVFLSGVADVLAYIQDDRYFPAQLPKLASYDRPFNPPRTLQEWGPVKFDRAQQARREEFEGLLEASSFGSDALREDLGHDPEPVPEQVMARIRAASEAPRCTKCGGVSGDHVGWAQGHLFTPPTPVETTQSAPCYRTKTHDAHKWLKGRKAVQCSGIPKA